ncbi:TonB-dependent siderophore receptor [Pseudomonas sp. S31]|uniref:TonB-dependent siderophore receptor n=1 Tax=Pseudomonas sp. S31 TaxID=1564473 RepID=UPI001911A21F|nr:TonB-dependent siderophore receptor [Pseudomonas sp. S31]MBK4999729.1 TonB-dependent siderophore receptor [Pseudomonas sp. S31]
MKHRITPLARAIHLVLATGLGFGALFATYNAQAQDPASATAIAQNFDIPAGPLDQVLSQFGRQARIPLSINASLTAGKSSQGVHGNLSVEQGFAQLLAGTGLNVLRSDGGNYLLVPATDNGNALELGATSINANGESAYGPVEGYVAKRTATATKTDTSVLETPQTINIVTQDEIKARGSMSVSDALRYTPGVQVDGFTARVKAFDEPTSRGFNATPMYLDGLHLPYGGGSTGGALQIDPYLLERVEVLKGPASVLYGQNQPGGIVNMVSKRPTRDSLHSITLGTGSYDRKYGAFDLGGPLDDQGTFLYRLTGVVNDTNSEVDYADQKRMTLAPSLTWNVNDSTTLTFYGHFQKDNDTPEPQGLPVWGTVLGNPNGHISRNRFIGEPNYASYDRDQFSVGYELSHTLNDVWSLKQNARYAYVDDRFVSVLHGYEFIISPTTGLNNQSAIGRYAIDWSQTNKVYGIDNMAQAVFKTGEVEHTLLLGVDYYHFNSQFLGRYQYAPPGIDLYNPVYGNPIDFSQAAVNTWDNTIRQTGLYLQDQIKWDRWFLTLGGRYDWATTENNQPLYNVDNSIKDEKFSGRVGFGYLFDNGVTPYFSYSESFQPNTGTDVSGNTFDASTGKQYEVGIKYQPPGSNSFVQISAYQIDRKNVLTSDLDNPGFSNQSGELRSTGLEVEGKAALTKQLNLIASVSRVDAEYTKDNDGMKGRHPIGISPLTASTWLDYKMPDDSALRGLGFGVGVRYVRSSPGTSTSYRAFDVPSYSVYDAMISYDLERSPLAVKGVRVQANVENIDDKRYVSRCSGVWECTYGQGRTVTANLTYDW